MEIFNKQPHITPLNVASKDLLFEVTQNYECIFNHNGRIYKIVIKKGLIFDGASIPRWTWSIIGKTPVGYMLAAALVHDLMYFQDFEGDLKRLKSRACTHTLQVLKKGRWVSVYLDYNRKESDDIMMDIIEHSSGRDNISRFRKWAIYRGVRLGGNKYWKRVTPLERQNPSLCKDKKG